MRKSMKNKRRSCAMCKPHKRNWTGRWKAKEHDALRRAEKEVKDAENV